MDRKTFVLLVLLPVSGLLLFSAGAACGYLAGTRGGSDPAGASEHERISADLEEVADGIERDSRGALDEVRNVGEKLDGSGALVGEIGSGLDKLTGEQGNAFGAVERIEEGIQRIDGILQRAEKKDAVF